MKRSLLFAFSVVLASMSVLVAASCGARSGRRPSLLQARELAANPPGARGPADRRAFLGPDLRAVPGRDAEMGPAAAGASRSQADRDRRRSRSQCRGAREGRARQDRPCRRRELDVRGRLRRAPALRDQSAVARRNPDHAADRRRWQDEDDRGRGRSRRGPGLARCAEIDGRRRARDGDSWARAPMDARSSLRLRASRDAGTRRRVQPGSVSAAPHSRENLNGCG